MPPQLRHGSWQEDTKRGAGAGCRDRDQHSHRPTTRHDARMTLRRVLAVLALVTASLGPALLVTSAPVAASGPCDNVKPGQPLKNTPWPQSQLDLAALQQRRDW